MRIVKKDVSSAANGVFYSPDATLSAVKALNPDVLIETTKQYIVGPQNGRAYKALNLAVDRSFVGGGPKHPYHVAVGGKPALRFGFGGDLTDAENGLLVDEVGGDISMSASYTIACVARRPTSTEKPSGNRGGPVIACGGPSGTPISGLFLDYGTPGVISIYHGGTLVAQQTGETVGQCVSVIISYNSASQQLHIWVNGVYKGAATGVGSWGGQRQVIVGGGTDAYWLVGDVAAVFVSGGEFYANGSAQITALNNWLSRVKSERAF